MKTSFRTLLIFLLLTGWSSAAPPPNDIFTGAQTITGSVVSVSGTTVDATGSANTDIGLDGNVSPAPSVYYRWTVPAGVTTASISVTFDDSTPGECIATLGNAPNPEPIGGLAQYRKIPGIPASRTFIIATAAVQVITFRVAEAPAIATGGTFTLSIAVNQVRTRPVNDLIANAVQLPGTNSDSATGTLSGATTDSSEHHQDVDDNNKRKTQAAAVWYRWTSPSPAFYGVSVIGPAAAEVTIHAVNNPLFTYSGLNGPVNRVLVGTGTSLVAAIPTTPALEGYVRAKVTNPN